MTAALQANTIRRVAITPDLLDVARKLQDGSLRKVKITEDMVGGVVHVDGSLSLVRSATAGSQAAPVPFEAEILSLMSEYKGIEMSSDDVADLLRDGIAEFAGDRQQIAKSLKALANQGKVSSFETAGAPHFMIR